MTNTQITYLKSLYLLLGSSINPDTKIELQEWMKYFDRDEEKSLALLQYIKLYSKSMVELTTYNFNVVFYIQITEKVMEL